MGNAKSQSETGLKPLSQFENSLGSGRWADGSVFHAGADSGTNFVFQRPPQRTRIGALLIFTRLSLCGARHRSTFLFLVSRGLAPSLPSLDLIMPSSKEKRRVQQKSRRKKKRVKEDHRLRHCESQRKYEAGKKQKMSYRDEEQRDPLDQPSPVESEYRAFGGGGAYDSDDDESYDEATKDRVAKAYGMSMEQQRLAGEGIAGAAAGAVAKETLDRIRQTEADAIKDIKSMSAKKKKKKQLTMAPNQQSAGQTARKQLQFESPLKKSNTVRLLLREVLFFKLLSKTMLSVSSIYAYEQETFVRIQLMFVVFLIVIAVVVKILVG